MPTTPRYVHPSGHSATVLRMSRHRGPANPVVPSITSASSARTQARQMGTRSEFFRYLRSPSTPTPPDPPVEGEAVRVEQLGAAHPVAGDDGGRPRVGMKESGLRLRVHKGAVVWAATRSTLVKPFGRAASTEWSGDQVPAIGVPCAPVRSRGSQSIDHFGQEAGASTRSVRST